MLCRIEIDWFSSDTTNHCLQRSQSQEDKLKSVALLFIRMYCVLYCSTVVGPLGDIFQSCVRGSGRVEGGSAWHEVMFNCTPSTGLGHVGSTSSRNVPTSSYCCCCLICHCCHVAMLLHTGEIQRLTCSLMSHFYQSLPRFPAVSFLWETNMNLQHLDGSPVANTI